MKNSKIFKKLLKLGIPQQTIYALEMQASTVGDVTIILGMARIIESYVGATREHENKVARLLALLSKNHFKDVK